MTSQYKPVLTKFMSFKDGVVYNTDRVLTMEELLHITPDHLCRWMNQLAYGDPVPSDDIKPVHRRSNTLEFAKKSISSFMPRINTTWDPVTSRGNPTRSDVVNKLIKKVKKFEVRREGAESKARRAVEFDEFQNLLLLARGRWRRDNSAVMVGSVLSLQWHICARIDDMMKLQFSNFSPNTQYSSTLHLQMRWSKNINEERDAPEHIVMGSMDPKMCALLNLGIYIESTANVTSSEFVYGNAKDGDRAVRRCLTSMVKNTAFKKLKTGKLGTHSLRKGAATYATRSGISKDFVNRRGRWRTQKGVVDVYIDNTQPYPDALTAATLSGPAGPCFYTLKAGICCVVPNLLVDQIAPTVKQLMGEAIATTLALPSLWTALVPSSNYEYDLLPSKLQQKISRAYSNVGGSTALNPVDRKEFYVTGDGSQLNLIVVASNEYTEHSAPAVGDQAAQTGNRAGCEGTRREFAALHSQIAAGRQHTMEMMTEIQRSRLKNQRELQKIQAMLKRLVMQPAFRQRTAAHSATDNPSSPLILQRVIVARLSK